MIIIGVDYHPSFQTIAFLMEETGEYGEQELNHSDGEAERFYRELKERGVSVRVEWRPPGMQAGSSGYSQNWVSSCGLEIRRRLRPSESGSRKPIARSRLMLMLLRENRFPKIWVPSPENRDLQQLLWHRHRLVQTRTRIMNQLQAVAMNEGYRWKKKLFSEKGRALLENSRWLPGPVRVAKNYWSCWTSWIQRLRS